MHTSLVPLNADEGVTGLQAYEVLRGKFRLIVAGNDYGSTTETYLIAPFLAFWSGVWPLRIVPIALSAVAGYALYRLARPIFGRVPAAALALIGWTTSGAVTMLFLRPYMGYTTGYIALIAALALACHAMRTEQRLARTAGFAGFAAGFAIWSHPIFGTVALLALIAPTLYRRRALRRWWLPLAAGGVLGVSPWLLFMAQNGLPAVSHAGGGSHLSGARDQVRRRAAPAGLRSTHRVGWGLGRPRRGRGRGRGPADHRFDRRDGAAGDPQGPTGPADPGSRGSCVPGPRAVRPTQQHRGRAVRPAVPAGAADGVGGVAAADPSSASATRRGW